MNSSFASRILICALVWAAASACTANAADPLPSWNDTPTKKAIVSFVEKVTKEGSPTFIPTAERIATFDNDGSLWSEKPVYFQLLFAIDLVKQLALQRGAIIHTPYDYILPARHHC